MRTGGRRRTVTWVGADLADALLLVLAALCDGSISLEHAQVIAGIRGRVPDEA